MSISGNPYVWNSLDARFELFLNHFAGRFPHFDMFVNWTTATSLVKGGPIIFLIWFFLFDRKRAGQLRSGFEFLAGSLFFSVVACIVSRGLAIFLPFRARPLATPRLHFHLPIGATMDYVDWSSFPSDHAALFFALAMGILMVSRSAGWFAMAWATFVVCFPRLYLGDHWPSDILAGAVIGILATESVAIPAVRRLVRRLTLSWFEDHPPLFLALLFLWSFETINLFGDVRHVLRVLAHSL
jgi:undecaprenyl-diphosphatase